MVKVCGYVFFQRGSQRAKAHKATPSVIRYQRRKIGFLCIWMIVTIYPSPNLKNISQMIVALYLGNMKMIVLLSLISTVCSCVHKNADKEV